MGFFALPDDKDWGKCVDAAIWNLKHCRDHDDYSYLLHFAASCVEEAIKLHPTAGKKKKEQLEKKE